MCVHVIQRSNVSKADFCRKAKQKYFLWLSQWLYVYLSTGLGTVCFDELILKKIVFWLQWPFKLVSFKFRKQISKQNPTI